MLHNPRQQAGRWSSLWGVIWALGLAQLLASPAAAQGPLVGSLNGQFGVSASTIHDLSFDYDSDTGELFTTVEIVPGSPWTLSLHRHSMRSDDFRLYIDVGISELRGIPAPTVRTWKGTVLEDPSIQVRASYQDNRIQATIYADQTYVIEPIPNSTQHIAYRGEDSLPQNAGCGVVASGSSANNGGGITPSGTGLRIVEVGLDADFLYYQGKGSNVIATVNALESRMNLVEPLYEVSPMNVTLEITTIIVRTTNSPYTSTDAGFRLDQFEDTWNSSPESAIRHDVAHLFTGQTFEDPPGSNFFTLGLASIGGPFGGVCHSTRSYGLSNEDIGFLSDFERTALVAHEIGHNFSADHCDGAAGGCKIMCANLGECSPLTPLAFSPVPAGEIASFANQISCLHDLPSPQTIPFEDNFESTSVSTARWSYIDGATTSTAGLGEPSGVRSLNLDSPGSGLFEFDEIRSNDILLGGSTAPVLRYNTEHRGVESGEQLIVEYLNSALDWITVNTITSNGVDQNSFVFHEHVLPASARHNGFRVRFTTDGNDIGDDWFIDDVFVGEPTPIVLPPVISSISPNAGSPAGGTLVSILGSNFDPSVIVTWGAQNIPATFVSANQLQVVTPPGSGSVSVIVTQGAFSDVATNGFLYSTSLLRIENFQAPPGSTVTVPVLATHTIDLEGYSFGVDSEGDLLQILSVTDIGTDAEGAGFFIANINNDPGPDGGWFTLGVIIDLQGPGTLPAGIDNVVCLVEYEIASFVPIDFTMDLSFDDTLNDPDVPINFAAPNQVTLTPDLADGSIVTVAGGIFIRGDANYDQTFAGLTDALFYLNYAFTNGPPPPCESAADANDDGTLGALPDVLYILNFSFSGGTPPPAPYPSAGSDPTPDSLTCAP